MAVTTSRPARPAPAVELEQLDLAGVTAVSAQKLRSMLAESSHLVDREQGRFLVGHYYDLQNLRIHLAHQERSLSAAGKPVDLLVHFGAEIARLEALMKNVLDDWTDRFHMGQWSKAHVGIGPVLAAGLLAHIDITRAPTVGHIWSFAGLNPDVVWAPKTKRPWNAELKTLCWKIGELIVKTKSNPKSFYGPLFDQRKAYEVERNETGQNVEIAKAVLESRRAPGKHTEARKALEQGKLPQAQVHARAKRWTVKLFLAHWHEEAYRDHYGKEPPLPYPIAHLGHAHKIEHVES